MEQKLIFKKWYFFGGFILIAVIIIGIYLLSNLNLGPSNGIGSAGISLEEFEKIQLGMNNFEVNDIIDSDDLWNDNEIYHKACIELSKESKNHIYTYKYKYIGEKTGYATITFSVDYSDGFFGLKYPTVISKENFNLK